jgi:hypothetical protein
MTLLNMTLLNLPRIRRSSVSGLILKEPGLARQMVLQARETAHEEDFGCGLRDRHGYW